ncbi:MAG: PqqD family protein [Proteobacteria bacterium]|nr:MAG: PqqD family protein [Pseudomonadota bacterium]
MTVRIPADVLCQEVEGEAVLLDLASGRYFGLNEVGTRFWRLATQHQEVGAIFRCMLEEYEVDEDTLARDLDAFLADVAVAGLLELVRANGRAPGEN